MIRLYSYVTLAAVLLWLLRHLQVTVLHSGPVCLTASPPVLAAVIIGLAVTGAWYAVFRSVWPRPRPAYSRGAG